MAMNNWFQNIKGQISEIASEVLQEATGEVEDPGTELQVEKNKATESERSFLAERSKNELFEKRVAELEEQLYSMNVENDAIKERFQHIISDRDLQIKSLQAEIGQFKIQKGETFDEFEDVSLENLPFYERSSTIFPHSHQHEEEVLRLKKQHHTEISALIAQHNEDLLRIHNECEEEIKKHKVSSPQIQITETSVQTDLESRPHVENESPGSGPLSDIGDSSSSNTDWERMGAESGSQTIEAFDDAILKCSKHEHGSSQLIKLKSELSEGFATTGKLNTQLKALVEENTSLMATLDQETNKLKEQILARDDEIMRLKDELTKNSLISKKEDPSAEEEKVLRVQIESISEQRNKEIEALQQKISELTVQSQEALMNVDELKEKLEDMENNFTRAVETHTREQQTHVDKIKVMEEENQKLWHQLEENKCHANEERSSMEDEISDLKARFVAVLTDNETSLNELKVQAENAMAQSEGLSENLRRKEAEFERYKVSAEQRHQAALEELNSKLKTEVNMIQSTSGPELFNRVEISAQTDNFGEDSEVEELRCKLSELSQHMANETHSDGNTELQEQIAQNEAKMDELQQKLAKESELSSSLREQLAEISAEFTEARLKFDVQLAEAKEMDSERLRQIETYRVEFERESSTNAQLKEQISTSELQLNELRINLSIESSLSASLREQMTETVEANVQLNSQLFNAKTDIDALTREINAYKGQIQRLANESASNSELHEQLVQKSLEFDEMQKNTSQMDGVNKQLSAQLKNSLMDIETLQKEIDSYRSQIEALISQQESKNDQKSDSKNDSNMQTDEFFDDNQQMLETLRIENGQLKQMLATKTAETDDLLATGEQLMHSYRESEAKLGVSNEELMGLNKSLAAKQGQLDKLNNELSRLRDHLLTIEDISSKEAIAAEERETDLRQRLASLQEAASSNSNGLVGSVARLQDELATLRAEVVSLEETNARLRASLSDRERQVADGNKSLGSLQSVLRGLDEDQKREKVSYEHEIRRLRADCEKLTRTVEDFAHRQKHFEDERLNLEKLLESQMEEVDRKRGLIEELESQLEELRSSSESEPSGGGGASTSSTSAYRIDDSTLRQLFISFFMADKSKQPEIAIVMSRILGYGPEEQQQIKSAIEQTAGPTSWLGFLSRSPRGIGAGESAPSLTEQFIRFLEQESRVAEARTLPIQHEAGANDDRIRVSEQPEPLLQDPYSLEELKSIIEATPSSRSS